LKKTPEGSALIKGLGDEELSELIIVDGIKPKKKG
jgi:hypothetical protein